MCICNVLALVIFFYLFCRYQPQVPLNIRKFCCERKVLIRIKLVVMHYTSTMYLPKSSSLWISILTNKSWIARCDFSFCNPQAIPLNFAFCSVITYWFTECAALYHAIYGDDLSFHICMLPCQQLNWTQKQPKTPLVMQLDSPPKETTLNFPLMHFNPFLVHQTLMSFSPIQTLVYLTSNRVNVGQESALVTLVKAANYHHFFLKSVL